MIILSIPQFDNSPFLVLYYIFNCATNKSHFLKIRAAYKTKLRFHGRKFEKLKCSKFSCTYFLNESNFRLYAIFGGKKTLKLTQKSYRFLKKRELIYSFQLIVFKGWVVTRPSQKSFCRKFKMLSIFSCSNGPQKHTGIKENLETAPIPQTWPPFLTIGAHKGK